MVSFENKAGFENLVLSAFYSTKLVGLENTIDLDFQVFTYSAKKQKQTIKSNYLEVPEVTLVFLMMTVIFLSNISYKYRLLE